MAQKNNTNTDAKVSKESPKKTVASKYTVEEFASAPQSIGAKNADIVRAALTVKGNASYTVEEATSIVKEFAKKEVK